MTLAEIITNIVDWFYWKPFRKLMPIQTFRYAICGIINLGVDQLSFLFFYYWVFRETPINLGFYVVSAHVAAVLLTIPIITVVGFWLNSHITFKKSPLSKRTQFIRYCMTGTGAIIINIVFIKVFIDLLDWQHAGLAKFTTTMICVVYSFLMQKYFTFRGAEKE